MGLDMYLVKKKKGQKEEYDWSSDLAYWRKANQIHNWFVNNVQDGNDDCEYYNVSKEKVEELLNICKKVLEESNLKPAKIKNGQSLINGEWVDNLEDGLIITNPEIAQELLPTTSGFFFGGTDYDEYYVKDLKYTIEEFEKILKEFDFENEYLVYTSSW